MFCSKRKFDMEHALVQPSKKQKILQQIYNPINYSENDVIDAQDYCKGGYHPVEIGDIYKQRYYVLEMLGWGGSSTVWRCLDLSINRFVALKVVKSSTVDTESALQEIKVLKRVSSNSIIAFKHLKQKRWKRFIQLLDCFKTTGVNGTHVCMVLELMDKDLIDLINTSGDEGSPLINVKGIISQILSGLDYLHSKCKIIHGDIKPNNILISKNKYCFHKSTEYCVKITDFGSACSTINPLSKGFQTKEYRSLEFILGTSIGPGVDLWSTACLAFELATGDCLFDCESDEHHLALITALLGDIPMHMVIKGKLSHQFYTEQGNLKYNPQYKSEGLFEKLVVKYKWDANEAYQFADFLNGMLTFECENRSSARRSLRHVWLRC